MSLFRHGCSGISLKALLENPELQNPPSLNAGGSDLKKPGSNVGAPINHGSAFLGPNLWERPNNDSNDFDFEYMDLDEFLSENGIPVDLEVGEEQPPVSLLAEALKSSPEKHSTNPGGSVLSLNIDPQTPPLRTQHSPTPQPQSSPKHPERSSGLYFPDSPPNESPKSPFGLCLSPVSPAQSAKSIEDLLDSPRPQVNSPSVYSGDSGTAEDFDNADISVVAIPGQDNFNPKERRFTDDELKPQPMIKKSRKVFVPDDCKDEKYWNRRKKNNIAAKRSRDARRVKENQIAMRASYLERENDAMKVELEALQEENERLKKRLAKYEGSQ